MGHRPCSNEGDDESHLMTIRLLDLVSTSSHNDLETSLAYFRTHVPWVAPQAYMHIIFKPTPSDALAQVAQKLRMPPVFMEFLKTQNGAILYSGALSIYGVSPPGQRLNRSDPFSRSPFDIERENSNWPPYDAETFIVIGGYGFDGSSACINRSTLHIDLFQRGEASLQSTPVCSWNSLDEWIRDEHSRLSMLFDSAGRRLVGESETVCRPSSRGPN